VAIPISNTLNVTLENQGHNVGSPSFNFWGQTHKFALGVPNNLESPNKPTVHRGSGEGNIKPGFVPIYRQSQYSLPFHCPLGHNPAESKEIEAAKI